MKKHTRIRPLFSLMLILCFTLTCCLPQPSSPGKQDGNAAGQTESLTQTQNAFEDFLIEEFQASFENDMLTLHYTLKNPELYDIEKPAKAFVPLTKEYNEQCKEELMATQEALTNFEKAALTTSQQILYDTLDKYLKQQIALSSYTQFLHVLGPNTGISSNLPLTLAEYTFYSEEDVKDYLAILPQIPSLLKEAFVWEKNQAKEGYGLSDFEIQDTINQIDTFLQATNENLLITSFNDRITALNGLSDDQKATYEKNNRNLVENTAIPAFLTLKNDLTALKNSASKGKGLAHYDKGLEYYELLIQSMTFSDRSINTLIKTMEKRLENLTKRILKVSTKNPDVYEIFYSTESYTDETPEEMLTYLKDCMKEDYPEIDHITYTVEPIPDALKNNSTAAYYMIPPLDSPTENRIYYGDRAGNSASLFMTLSHEGYPGHLYHQNYMLANGLHPIYYVLDITGYKEAWAYYVEVNAADYCNFGKYDTEYHDALTELHRCDLEFSYAISSLIDLYVNGKGYDEEQVGQLLERYGLDSTSAKAFFEYAVEEPGAYLQYYVGYLELLEIRQNTEKSLGNAFDEKTFHTEILNTGPCYFDTLADLIGDF